ncbi:unnamed protein product [Owenia fusiformis]|uniref:Uncharacterized protein n=1 Tax=Owenia fusiformis TaxID=6347 RepID=A0A8J1XVS9_OWEFU|nr:unnamed protein product [Owenia fusiformis]
MSFLLVYLLGVVSVTVATPSGTASKLSEKCGGEYNGADDSLREVADGIKDEVLSKVTRDSSMYNPKASTSFGDNLCIKVKIYGGSQDDEVGRYAHVHLDPDGAVLLVEDGKHRMDCCEAPVLELPDSNLGDDPEADARRARLLKIMNEKCPEFPPVEYKLVQQDEEIKDKALSARAGFEAEYGKQLKWDANTYIKVGEEYIMKIRVLTMEDKPAFIHIRVDAQGNFLSRDEGLYGRKDCLKVPPQQDVPIFGDDVEGAFSRQMTERCGVQYWKVNGSFFDDIKNLKDVIVTDLALDPPYTKFQPRVYCRSGDDIYVKIRYYGFAIPGGRYAHAHLDVSGEYVDVEGGLKRKTCVEQCA